MSNLKTLHFVAVGGTGHKVLQALIHIAACGAFKGKVGQIRVLTIDADDSNGNLSQTKTTLSEYEKFYGALGGCSELGLVDIQPVIPSLNLRLYHDGKSSLGKTFNTVQYDGTQTEKLLRFLYTDDEIREEFDQGFYGHTSIGTVIVKDIIRGDNTWKEFLSGINDNEFVMIAGSIFGGTGASSIPVVLQELNEKRKGSTNPFNVASLMLAPYFNTLGEIKEEGVLQPNSSTFHVKAKAALYYYNDQRQDEMVDALYVIGEPDVNFSNEASSRGSVNQRNKAHPMELFAALATLDFVREPKSVDPTRKIRTAEREAEKGGSKYYYTWKMIQNNNQDLPSGMQLFTKIAIFYNKILYGELLSGKSISSWRNYYATDDGGLETKRDSNNNFVYQNIFAYCKRFLKWMYDLHKENQREIDHNTGKMKWEPDGRVKLFNAYYSQLFDNQPVMNGKIVGFDELVVEQNDGIRSEKLYSDLASKRPAEKGFVALFSTLYEIVGKTPKGGIFGLGKKGKPVVHDYINAPYFSRENDAGLQRSEAEPGKMWSSDSIKLLLNIADGLPMTSGNFTRNDISIPSPWSIFIMNELTLTKEKFSGVNTEAYRQWCAMITLLALRKVNNYNTLELVKIEDDSNGFFNVVRDNLKPINYVFENQEWVRSPYVQLKGKTIAFLANNTLVCPTYSFDGITKAELRRIAPAIIDESDGFASPDTYFKDQSLTYNKNSKFALSIFLKALGELISEISKTTTSKDLIKELSDLIKRFRGDLDLDNFSYSNADIAIPTDTNVLSAWDVFENMIPEKNGGAIELPFELKGIKGERTVLIGQEIASISSASSEAASIYITDDKKNPILFNMMVPSKIEELDGTRQNGLRLVHANSLLCDTMVMVMKENSKNGFESLSHGVSFSLQDYEVVWPIDKKLLAMYSMEELNNNLTASLDRENIKVSLQLKIEGKMGSHTVTKTYRIMTSDSLEDRGAKNVCLTIDKGRLPFWAVWPFAKAVKNDDNNLWQRYNYLCVEPRYRPGVPVMEIKPFFDGDTDDENEENRSQRWSGSPQKLSSVSNAQRDISYRRSSDLPIAFKLFEKTQDGDIYRGAIFLKKPEKVHEQKEGITWNVGLDFGTTSTTAYFTTRAHPDPRFIQLLPEYKWVEGQDEPPRDSNEEDNAIGILADFGPRDYLEQCFIDEQTLNQKGYTTTYELLDETERDTERTLFTTGRIFWHNYKNLRLVNSDPEGKRRERLHTNIKWEGDTTYTGKFLNQLMTQIAYKAASRGAHKINWFFSYPTAFSGRNRGAFGGMLSKITENIAKETGIKNEYDNGHLITESIAAAYYFKYKNPRETVFLCLDIGGGTSDVSICVKDKYVFQSSIRFASRDMFITPLLELLYTGSVLDEVGKAEDDRIGTMLVYKGASDDDKAKFFIETVLFEFYDTFWDRLIALQGENKAAFERFTYRVFIAYSGLIFYIANIVAELLNKKGIDKDEIGQTIILGLSGKGSKLTDWIREYCSFLYEEAQNLIAEKTKSYASPEGISVRFKQQFESESAKTETAIGLICNLDHQTGTHTKKLEEKDPEIFLGSEVEVTKDGKPHEIKDKFVNPYEDPFRDPSELSVKIDQNIDALDEFIQFFNSVAAKTRGDMPPVSIDSVNGMKKDLRSQINTQFENVRSSGRFDPPFIVILDVFLKECLK